MRWALLPPELRLRVASFLDQKTLKCLRQSNKSHGAAVATTYLFEEIWITRSRSSVERSRRVAHDSTFSKYVTTLVLNQSITNEDILHTPEAFRAKVTRYFEPWLYQNSAALPLNDQQIDQLYQVCLNDLHDEKQIQDYEVPNILMEFLHVFPNLSSVRTSGNEYYWSSTESGLVYWPKYLVEKRGAWSDEAVLKALSTAPIDAINLISIKWPIFAQDLLKQSILSNTEAYWSLRRLKLSLDLYQPPINEISKENNRAFNNFLRCVNHNLTHLSLNCCDPPYRQFCQLVSVSRLVFDLQWPELTSLGLFGMSVNEDAIVRFLGEHRTHLTKLELGEIIVTKTLDVDEMDKHAGIEDLGSVISLFWRIPTCCNLKEVHLVGRWSNGFTEAWDEQFEDYVRRNTFREKFERYVSKKGDWPFVDIDSWMQLAERRLKLRQRLRKPKRPIAPDWTDQSWIWDHELLQYEFD